MTTTRSIAPDFRSPSTARASMVHPPSSTNALGNFSPNRTPRPAAGTRATTATVSFVVLQSGRGREDLVENGLCLLGVSALGERELSDENLTSLGEHALLTSGKSAVLLTTPQVTNNFCNLVHVT